MQGIIRPDLPHDRGDSADGQSFHSKFVPAPMVHLYFLSLSAASLQAARFWICSPMQKVELHVWIVAAPSLCSP